MNKNRFGSFFFKILLTLKVTEYLAFGTDVHGSTGSTKQSLYDFLLIAGGRDTNGIVADRYCGNALNPVPLAVPVGAAVGTTPVLAAAVPGGSATSVQVCTDISTFRMTYQTDGTGEAITTIINAPTVPVLATADTANTANTGFCLDYQER